LPELPEVEIVGRGLAKKIVGLRLDRVEVRLDKIVQGNTRAFAQALTGARVRGVRRKGKILVVDLGQWLMAVHLKMTGRFSFVRPDQPLLKHTHLCFSFEDAPFELRYQDMRQFGWFRLLKPEELDKWPAWAELGPDALDLDEKTFLDRLAKRKGRLKSLLLNQAFVAGLGNIYADEALFRAGLHPLRPANSLSTKEKKALFRAISQVLKEALECGGSSIVNFQDAEGNLGNFQTRHLVYGRQGDPCLKCGQTIQRIKVGGRSSFFCPACQRQKVRKAGGRP